jgi:2-polyprenyl-3-methyl-5-hydroxy-6-metoxy-1,4-benzoquinol methylase
MKLHNALYNLCGVLAIAVNAGTHPKHRLLRYQEWFYDQIKIGSVVVDIGSNAGTMAAMLAEKARHVYGIEIVPALVELARSKYSAKNLEFIVGDATVFDYSNFQPIDYVTLSNVLEHVRERSAFINLLRRRLPWRDPKHCNFLIRVPTIERDWLAVYKKELGVEYRLDHTHEVEHTYVEFLEELLDAGLEVDNIHIRFGEFWAVCKGAAE